MIKWTSRNLHSNHREIRVITLITFLKGLGKARNVCSSATLAVSSLVVPSRSLERCHLHNIHTHIDTWCSKIYKECQIKNCQRYSWKTLQDGHIPFERFQFIHSVFESIGAATTTINRSIPTATLRIKKAAQCWSWLHYKIICWLGYDSTAVLSSITVVWWEVRVLFQTGRNRKTLMERVWSQRDLGLSPGAVTCHLCDLSRVTYPFSYFLHL